MLRAFHRWWDRVVERRRAGRRAAEIGRYDYAPFYRGNTLGKPRFGRFDTFFNPRRWLFRLFLFALFATVGWVLWESWQGLGIFDA